MNILLNIPDDITLIYQKEAEKQKRSRKNLMEKVLIEYFEKACEEILNTPEVKQAKKKAIDDLIVTGGLNREIIIQDLTNKPPKSNYVANNNPKIKVYDYSSIPEGIPYNKKKALMAKLRVEQDKQ